MGRRDIFPKFDKHPGLVQQLPCFQESILQCHYAQTSICEVVHKCDMPVQGLNRGKKLNYMYCYCCVTGDAETMEEHLGTSESAEFDYCNENAPFQEWDSYCGCTPNGKDCPDWVPARPAILY